MPRPRTPRQLTVTIDRFPLAARFVISRGAKTEAVVVTATISEFDAQGRGECVPYSRYGEIVQSVVEEIETARAAIEAGATREELQTLLAAGAARNALDCALWDFEAKRTGRRVYEIAGLAPPRPVTTAFTLSLGPPEEMATAAKSASTRHPLLKLKFGAKGDAERLAAIRAAAPSATLIVDANEGWCVENLEENFAACAKARVALIEQPLPAGADEALARIPHAVPVCADESLHQRSDLGRLVGRYDAVNIKLDKAGGLTEALALQNEAERLGFEVMIGCMVTSSLAMAPAMILASRAKYVDLDGPLLLAQDRENGLRYDGATVFPPEPSFWG
ncbi:MAG TPA: N-acetyl-D-Glu racemase DgcA [Methylovirgula sp.]